MYIDGRIVHQKKYYEVQEPNQTFKSIHHGEYHWLEGTTITSKTVIAFFSLPIEIWKNAFWPIFFGRFCRKKKKEG